MPLGANDRDDLLTFVQTNVVSVTFVQTTVLHAPGGE